MKLKLQRFHDNGQATLGMLFVDDKFECFTLEDTYRESKIQGETRIPAGKYWVDYRPIESPKTKKYQDAYSWFKWHLHIKDVPNFKYVYIHIGNNKSHTDGCILVGNQSKMYGQNGPEVLGSKVTFKSLYQKVSRALDMGDGVQIEINDTL